MHNIDIILTRPSHPGNIGAAARAIKTMGMQNLHLVAPQQFPHPDATARAAGADDLLESAPVHADILPAIENCQLVLGTSARPRHRSLPRLNPREAAQLIAEHAAKGQRAAVLFGNEKFGLSNEEMSHCQAQVSIPTDDVYSSLNLAAAVQIIAYECRMAVTGGEAGDGRMANETPATQAQIHGLVEHYHSLMTALGIVNAQNPTSKRDKLMHLYQRARITTAEIDLLRGFLKCIDRRVMTTPEASDET